MAAPNKEGLDYFPFDVGLLADRKLRRPKLKYGYLATMVYLSLLSILYKDKGYYIEYSPLTKEDVLWEIIEYLQGKYQPTAETVAEIIENLVACELFSGDQFKSKIITSIRAQRTFYRSTVDRKTVKINFDIWLLSEEEMKAMSERSIILHNFINQSNNGVNRPSNKVNQSNNSQSKVKESKVNNTPLPPLEGEEEEQANNSEKELKEIWKKYEAVYSKDLQDAVLQWLNYKKEKRQNYKPQGLNSLLLQLQKKAETFGNQTVIEAIESSMASNYQGIMWDKMNKQPNGTAKQNRFVNFEQRQWDFSELERLERERLQKEQEKDKGK